MRHSDKHVIAYQTLQLFSEKKYFRHFQACWFLVSSQVLQGAKVPV